MDSNKSHGIDGFGARFFKTSWSIIGTEVVAAMNSLIPAVCPRYFQQLAQFLFPKLITPSVASDFRPIACCSILYKCVAKLISNRLNTVLLGLVNGNLGAFVKGRNLQDILRVYGRSNKSPRCLFKIDIGKAHDTVSQRFVENLLNALLFPTKFIKWVMSCLRGAYYVLLLNGRIQEEFEGKTGLRQGDPMSPLLFVLVMEYFTRVLHSFALNSELKFHSGCRKMGINSLCFADDLILLCKAEYKTVSSLLEAFKLFSLAPGLMINKRKSCFYFCSVADTGQRVLLDLAGVEKGSFLVKYLGVPLKPTKWNRHDCACVVEKFRKIISC